MSKRPPEPGELKTCELPRLLALYRRACIRLRDAGHWELEPLASEWARALANELAERGRHEDCLCIEREVNGARHGSQKKSGAVPEPTRAGGQRKRWEV